MEKRFFYKMAAAIIAVIAFSSCQSEGYVITGRINTKDLDGSKIFLRTENPNVSDSTIIENGTFSFRGQVEGILQAAVTIGDNAFPFLLVNDRIRIDINNDDWDTSDVQYRQSRAAENISKYFEENRSLFIEPYMELGSLLVNARGVPEKENAARQKIDDLVHSYMDLLVERFANSDNREGLSIIVSDLTRVIAIRDNPDRIKELYVLIPENERMNAHSERAQIFFDQHIRLAVGQPVDFGFTDYRGVAGKVSDYKGKFVLVYFWATWCAPCLVAIPIMEQMFSAYADKIKVITVSIDEDIERWKAKVPDLDTSWTHIHYRQEIDLRRHFFISGVPDNLLLSQDGKILRKRVNPNNILSYVR